MNECSLIFVSKMRARDENKEQAIRTEAIKMIAEKGLDGLSMQKLAKAAKVSPATIYIYYKDRDDLVIQLCEEVSNKLLATSFVDFDPDMSFEEGLKIQWRNRAAFFMSNPLDVLFIEQVRNSPLYSSSVELLMRNFGQMLGKFCNKAIENKQLVKLSFEVYWSVAFAPLYQLIKFHHQGNSHCSVNFELTQEVLEKALQLVLKALKP